MAYCLMSSQHGACLKYTIHHHFFSEERDRKNGNGNGTTDHHHHHHLTDKDLAQMRAKRRAARQARLNPTKLLKHQASSFAGVSALALAEARSLAFFKPNSKSARESDRRCYKLGEQRQRMIDSRRVRQQLLRERQELLFLHIPKNGGTAIEHELHASNHNYAERYLGKDKQSGRLNLGNVYLDLGDGESCKCSYWHVPPR